jgi:hypothetical protein
LALGIAVVFLVSFSITAPFSAAAP